MYALFLVLLALLLLSIYLSIYLSVCLSTQLCFIQSLYCVLLSDCPFNIINSDYLPFYSYFCLLISSVLCFLIFCMSCLSFFFCFISFIFLYLFYYFMFPSVILSFLTYCLIGCVFFKVAYGFKGKSKGTPSILCVTCWDRLHLLLPGETGSRFGRADNGFVC